MSQIQAAEFLGVTRQRVAQLIREGQLTYVPFAGYRFVVRSQVVALARKREARKHPQS